MNEVDATIRLQTSEVTELPSEIRGIYREYFNYHIKYTSKYGPKVIVLMCVGAFYETYQYDLPNFKLGMCFKMRNAIDNMVGVEFAVYMMNKKKEHSFSNPYRLGFGVAQLEKWKTVLLNLGFILVKVDQKITLNGNKKIITRSVAKILTLATDIELAHKSTKPSNRIVSILVDIQKFESKIENSLVVCGYSWIDLITGDTFLGETASTEQDCNNFILKLSKLLSIKPKEIIIYILPFKTTEKLSTKLYQDYLYRSLKLYEYDGPIIYKTDFNKEYIRCSYQLKFLKKIYASKEVEEYVTYLYATASLILLLNYCSDHDTEITKRLTLPKLNYEKSNKLFISRSTVVQLNLFSNYSLDVNIQHKKINSLISVIDYTKTILGHRYLIKRINKPYTNCNKIKKCYDIITDFISNPELISQTRLMLRTIPDLSLLHRRLILSKISIYSLSKLKRIYQTITNIYDNIVNIAGINNIKQLIPDKKQWNLFQNYYQLLKDILCTTTNNMTKIENNYIESSIPIFTETVSKYSIFNSISKKYINQIRTWNENYFKLNEFKEKIHKLSNCKSDLIYIGCRYYLVMTTSVASKLKKSLPDIKTEQIRGTGKKTHVYTDNSEKLELLAGENRLEWQKLSHTIYTILLNTIYKDYSSLFVVLRKFVSKIDYFQNGAFIAIKYNYCKPEIENSIFSYVYVKQIRHPIVEILINNEYIPNDIFLGSTSISIKIKKISKIISRSIIKKPKGMLLYGCNSSGKSTLTKSLGIAVIMAQSGYYVPALKFVYSPYHNLITRLSGNDNIFTNDSSFVVEMKELSTILKNSDQNTLVLGDELCRGTESISATSLTISTLQYLMKKKSTFIFSTHLHQLPQSKFLKKHIENKELVVNHLDVECDLNNNLKYNRKLITGKGSSMYGIEVAKSLGLPKDFLENTYNIRKYILGNKELYSTKRSRYNSSVYMDMCVLCGERFNLETHHIREQKLANSIKYIGHVYRDAECNLSVLCKACHLKMSSGFKIEKSGDNYKLLKKNKLEIV